MDNPLKLGAWCFPGLYKPSQHHNILWYFSKPFFKPLVMQFQNHLDDWLLQLGKLEDKQYENRIEKGIWTVF